MCLAEISNMEFGPVGFWFRRPLRSSLTSQSTCSAERRGVYFGLENYRIFRVEGAIFGPGGTMGVYYVLVT